MCGLLVAPYAVKEDQTQIERAAESLIRRGPDASSIHFQEKLGWWAFHRLAIQGPDQSGMQPMIDQETILTCNGEIYNWRELKAEIKGYHFQSSSDCEILLPLLKKFGLKKTCGLLDGEFAFVAAELGTKSVFAARDPMGIRPLFFGEALSTGSIIFASEAKALVKLCDEIKPFPPGHYFLDGEFFEYHDSTSIKKLSDSSSVAMALGGISYHLSRAVEKRLNADQKVGALLSGGLDSSLVCALAAKKISGLTTFAVGIEGDPIDTKYAQIAADYIGTDHHEVLFTKDQVFSNLREMIYQLETFDITTIRASVGMYLVCKYIKEETDVKVVLTGEVSDEVFGYKYTDFAPSALEFQKESEKRVRELYLYDVLRADRCISSHGLEARVPFSDKEFVSFVMSLDPKIKMNSYGMGKYLLREAFAKSKILPGEILYREKAAFSDAVGHSCVDSIKAYAESIYTSADLRRAQSKYEISPPRTKEALMYRDIFESFYPGKAELIPGFWMPNKEWDNCDVDDPSARALPNYGASGF